MLQFCVAVSMAKLTVPLSARGVQQAIKQYYRFSLYIIYLKMAKALRQLMRDIAVIPCGGNKGWRDLRQN